MCWRPCKVGGRDVLEGQAPSWLGILKPVSNAKETLDRVPPSFLLLRLRSKAPLRRFARAVLGRPAEMRRVERFRRININAAMNRRRSGERVGLPEA